MKTTARVLNQRILPRSSVFAIALTRAHLMVMAMAVGFFISALSIVYVTHSTRCLTSSIQQMLTEREHLRVQWQQLLLEKSTWIMQAHVQKIAEDNLQMVVPDHQSTVIINE